MIVSDQESTECRHNDQQHGSNAVVAARGQRASFEGCGRIGRGDAWPCDVDAIPTRDPPGPPSIQSRFAPGYTDSIHAADHCAAILSTSLSVTIIRLRPIDLRSTRSLDRRDVFDSLESWRSIEINARVNILTSIDWLTLGVN